MNAKWYVSTLFIILALLGLSQEQKKASNQQILLEFEDVELASECANDEILTVITKKLEILGIDAVEIIENNGSQVSIRYYSDVDAVSVKEFLSQEDELSLANEDEAPLDNKEEPLPEKYSLVVSDFHQHVDNDLIVNGTLVSFEKQEVDQLSNPVIQPFGKILGFELNDIVSTAFKINRSIAIEIDNTSQTIPEVRAGPYVHGNS